MSVLDTVHPITIGKLLNMETNKANTPKSGKTRRKHRSSKKSKKEKAMREELNQPAINEFITGSSQTMSSMSAKKRTPPSAEKRPEKRLIMTGQNKPLEDSETSEDSDSDSETEEEYEESPIEAQSADEQAISNKDLEEQLLKLSPELRILHDLMKKQLDDTMIKKLSPLQKNLDKLLKDKKRRDKQLKELKKIATSAESMQEKCDRIERENIELKNKLVQLEDKSLENNLIIQGVEESEWEQIEETTSKVRKVIVDALPYSKKKDRYEASRKILLHKVRRIGRYNSQKSRPISVSFVCQQDADNVYKNKTKMKKGIYIDREYSAETERERKVLRVIMHAAKNLKDYEGKYKLEGNTLQLKGKRYTLKNLHELPPELNGFEVS